VASERPTSLRLPADLLAWYAEHAAQLSSDLGQNIDRSKAIRRALEDYRRRNQ
jgi:hypothetical protein